MLAQAKVLNQFAESSRQQPITYTQKQMAPKKKADNELGTVVNSYNKFRVEVKFAGRTMIGPTRVERSTAEADLVAMRAFPRAEMPKLLSDLMAALV